MKSAIKKKYQIFISSTYKDLKSERQAAVSTILKAGHIPAGMELFTASDVTQMDVIKRWIDSSDIYMLILGGRYGSVEPTTNLSYTELEYDYAAQTGMPMFSVVINEDALEAKVKAHGTDNMEKDNPKELAAFKSKVLSNMSSFFSNDGEIKLAVYESISDFVDSREMTGWIPGDSIGLNSQADLELVRLRAENEELRSSIKDTISETSTAEAPISFDDIEAILSSLTVKIPEHMEDDWQDEEASVLDVSYKYMRLLVTGVSNRSTSGSKVSFLYFNIASKLGIYGMTDFNSIKQGPGLYRQATLNERGKNFFAWYERRLLLK